MKILIDTHVHTVASGHAYSTIDEIARAASEKGLEIVAITDHSKALPGGANEIYFNNMRILPDYLYGVRILKGVETNIIDYNGNIDLDESVLKHLDIVIASLHPPCIPFASEEEVTKAVIKTMENPWVDIIGHPGDSRYPMNMEQMAYHAKKNNVLLEVNNSSLKPTSFRKDADKTLIGLLDCCKHYETSIVVASDSHFSHDVGDLKEAIQLLESVNFPEHLIINANKERFRDFIKKER